MFPFLSSARIHLNSRCLFQAVFDSGSVDFDAEVIRPSSWRGSVLCCRSRRCLVPVRAPSPAPGRDPAAAAHQQDGWGAAPAGLLTAPGGAGGSAQRPWLRSPAELRRKTPAPRDGRQQVLRSAWCRAGSRAGMPDLPGAGRCWCRVNANLSPLRSLEFSNCVAVQVAASFRTGNAKLWRYRTSAKKI